MKLEKYRKVKITSNPLLRVNDSRYFTISWHTRSVIQEQSF